MAVKRIEVAPTVCPTCGLDSFSQYADIIGGWIAGNYLCPLDHVWTVRWPRPGGAVE